MASANSNYTAQVPQWNSVTETPAPVGKVVFISNSDPSDKRYPVTAFVSPEGFSRTDGSVYTDEGITYWMDTQKALPMVPPQDGRYQFYTKDDTARFFDSLLQRDDIKKTWVRQCRSQALNHFDMNYRDPNHCAGATRCGLTAEEPWVEVNIWVGEPPENCGPITLDCMVRCRNKEGEIECMDREECLDILKDPQPTPEEIAERSAIERKKQNVHSPMARQDRLLNGRSDASFFVEKIDGLTSEGY